MIPLFSLYLCISAYGKRTLLMNFLSCPISLASVSAKAAASSPGMGRHCDLSQLRVRSFSENTLRIPSRLKKKKITFFSSARYCRSRRSWRNPSVEGPTKGDYHYRCWNTLLLWVSLLKLAAVVVAAAACCCGCCSLLQLLLHAVVVATQGTTVVATD